MYVKVFEDILHSTLWCEDSDTRIVWLTLLLMADQDGIVRATAPGIAHQAQVPIDVTRAALERFEAPDPDSRTTTNEGRRIERIDGGYVVLNYKAYRDLKTQDERRAEVRERVRLHRERKRQAQEDAVTNVTECNPIQKQKQTHKQSQTADEAGPWRTERVPYLREFMNAFSDPKKGENAPDGAAPIPKCPIAEIVVYYNTHRGALPQALALTGARKAKLRGIWRTYQEFRERWQDVINKASVATFLLPGGKFGKADFAWLMWGKKEGRMNFEKVLMDWYPDETTKRVKMTASEVARQQRKGKR